MCLVQPAGCHPTYLQHLVHAQHSARLQHLRMLHARSWCRALGAPIEGGAGAWSRMEHLHLRARVCKCVCDIWGGAWGGAGTYSWVQCA